LHAHNLAPVSVSAVHHPRQRGQWRN
jgi:hypothetical protein